MTMDRDTLSNVTRKMEILCKNLNRSVQPVNFKSGQSLSFVKVMRSISVYPLVINNIS